MKKLEYKGRTFFYKIESGECGDHGGFSCHETIFHRFVKVSTRKKYWLFGPDVIYDEYEELFKFDYNIENPTTTKEKLRADLDKQVALLDRYDEIKKGEIV